MRSRLVRAVRSASIPSALFGGIELASAACASGLVGDRRSSSLPQRAERAVSPRRIESQVTHSRASWTRLLAGSARKNCSIATSRLAGSESWTALVYAVSPAVLDCRDQRLEFTTRDKAKIARANAGARRFIDSLKPGIYPVRCCWRVRTYKKPRFLVVILRTRRC